MNPVTSIGGVSVKAPSSYKLGSQDVVAPGAGRSLNATMQKKTVAQKLRIDLEWKMMSYADATKLLNATSGEFFSATILGLNGTMQTKTFYRGDIQADFYGEPLNKWMPVRIALIER